jgi:hypothetical protein
MKWTSVLLSLTCVLIAFNAANAEPKSHLMALPSTPEKVRVEDGKLFLRLKDRKGWLRPVFAERKLTLEPTTLEERPAPAAWQQDSNRLPDGELTFGGKDIAAAWLTLPTDRYDHAVLGDAIEAGGLAAVTKDGRRLGYTLSNDAVFEDRIARLADIDGDGRDEVIVVKSLLSAGAALAAYKPGHGALLPMAEADPIGLAHRWLNPVGVADFDGDGKAEIAAVITPHIGGRLTLFGLKGNRLVAKFVTSAFSNHAIGSRQLALAAFADFFGDGRIVIALPDAGRGAMRLVTFAGGRFADLGTFRHGSDIEGPVTAQDLDDDGRPELVYLLSDGRLVALRF